MAKSNSTTVERNVWEGAEGRAVVVRHGHQDYEARLDGRSCGYFKYSFQAEHELAVLLEEQARELAIQLADEAAERDAMVEERPLLDDVTGEEIGAYFVAGNVEIFVADDPVVEQDRTPSVFIGGSNAIPLESVERVIPAVQQIAANPALATARAHLDAVAGVSFLTFERAIPALLAILADPRFMAARERLHASCKAPSVAAEDGVVYADAGPLQIGVDADSVLLTLELPRSVLQAFRELCAHPAVMQMVS